MIGAVDEILEPLEHIEDSFTRVKVSFRVMSEDRGYSCRVGLKY